MNKVTIIEVDQYLNTNYYGVQTKVFYNVWENDEIKQFSGCEIDGRVSAKKALKILDNKYLTDEEYEAKYSESKNYDLRKLIQEYQN